MISLPVTDPRVLVALRESGRHALKYSLRGVSNERLSLMARNAERTSRAVATNLNALLPLSRDGRVSDRIWRLAVDVADGRRDLADAVAELTRFPGRAVPRPAEQR